MKRNTAVLIAFFFGLLIFAEPENDSQFGDYFTDATLRVDMIHFGNGSEEAFGIDSIIRYPKWAGSDIDVIDSSENGKYRVIVKDKKSGIVIFTRGYDSYFGEYATTQKAIKGVKKGYRETALIPFPLSEVVLELCKREKDQSLTVLFSENIDPDDVTIKEAQTLNDVRVVELHKSGNPHKKVDIVFVAEGYTAEEYDKAIKDFNHFTDVFFHQEPYKSMKEYFNIYGAFSPSNQSGISEPTRGKFKDTAVHATFYSLNLPRYMLTEDNKNLRDIAGHVPYDAVLVMVNHKRYGGGGIYNFYCTFTTDNEWSDYVFLHEFGHSFGGLADEYYSSAIVYNDFYPKGFEPIEPNITALIDGQPLKWGHLIEKDTPVPTPWGKQKYDAISAEFGKLRKEYDNRVAKLTREGASAEKVDRAKKEAAELMTQYNIKMDTFLSENTFTGKVGVFEGAGYCSEGMYRPMLDCIMFSRGNKPFCKVCEDAVRKRILQYCQ